MQMSYGLYRGFLVDLAYLKEPVVNAFQVVSFTRKKAKEKYRGVFEIQKSRDKTSSFSTKCKVVKYD